MNKHSFMCNCSACKNKRRSSGCYIGLIAFWIVVIFYQAIITIFFTITWNAVILFLEIILLFFLIFRIIW
jgi:hypothetical protein